MTVSPDRVSLAKLRADVERARALEAKIGPLQAELKPLIDRIKAAMGSATFGTLDRKVAVTWSTTTRRSVDTKVLRQEQPEIAEKYTHTVTVRSFRIEP
jgi:predicted phage-related endonuclease